jgi:hypothetical protein
MYEVRTKTNAQDKKYLENGASFRGSVKIEITGLLFSVKKLQRATSSD